MIHRYLLLLIFSLFFFTGCTVATKAYHQPEIDRAERLLNQGKNKQAAAIYRKLADLNTNQRSEFQLLAADALISSGQTTQGAVYVDAINPTELTSLQLNHLRLLQGQVLLAKGNATKALNLLQSVKPLSLGKRLSFAYYNTLAATYSAQKDPMNSVRALINLDPYMQSAQARNTHYNRILKTLTAVPKKIRNQQKEMFSKSLKGWVALTDAITLNKGNLGSRLAVWRKAYPLHPVTEDFLLTYEKQYQKKDLPAQTIAVFLPKSGRYAEAAKVIKRGFKAAANIAKKKNANQPKIVYYDTEKGNIVKLYRSVVKKGATLVIGPLNKDHVKNLAKGTKLTVPVLALNHVDNLTAQNLYQFGLSPIDDAEQVANKAFQDGYKNALMLLPKSKRGKRIGEYFARHWQGLGANTASMQTYNASKTNFSKTIAVVAKEVSKNTVDVIFMNAYTKQGRSLNPQLRYKKGITDLPIYATSHIYQGTVSKKRDEKLNGITFCDIPWVFDDVYSGALSKKSLQSLWKGLSPLYLRLLPLGIDAYNLIGQLNVLKTATYPGATGRLTLAEDNRVKRELFCAQFVNGNPSLLNFSSEEMKFNP
ncbi:MAG: penicillin-binding protein activator [Methylococcales bacterium]|nr:penicillin-binding protein activator [Methylococcales bacterium]